MRGLPSRSRLLRRAAVLAAACSIAGFVSAQGETGFLRGAGRADVALSFNREDYGSDYRLGSSPFAPPIAGVERDLYGLYVAYGARADLDLVFNAAYVEARGEGEALGLPDEQGLQDGAFYLKWRATQGQALGGRLVWLLAPGVEFRLDDYTDFEQNALNGLGEGDTVLRARSIVQLEFEGAYAALEVGYDHHVGELDDEVPIHLTTGIALGSSLWLQPYYSTIVALGDAVSNPLLDDTQDGYSRLGLGLYWGLSDSYGLSAGVRRSDEGRNESTGFSLGVVLRL